jgi:tetratricopeptide (TPR) repeat protein
LNKSALNKLQTQIKDLISNGYLEDALRESEKLTLRDKDHLTLTNLEAQYNQAKSERDSQNISNQEFTLIENRIQLALLELSDKGLIDDRAIGIEKTINFFKRFWAIIGGLGVIVALLSNSKSILEGCKSSPKNEITIQKKDSLECNFPKTFKDDSLYILITAFEDDAQKYGTDCFGLSLLRRIDAKNMPIKICYRPDLAPRQKDEVRRLQNKYNADLVLWGNLKNLSQNCGEGDICFKSMPSDTIIKICGGEVETEKTDLNYEKGISSEDIEKGALHIGNLAFDSWIYAVFNAKVGKKKPDFFVIDEALPQIKQADLWLEKGKLYSAINDSEKSIDCYAKSIQLNPNNASTYINLGDEKSKGGIRWRGDYRSAIVYLDKGIQLNPNDAHAYFLRGVAKRYLNYRSIKQNIDAIVDLDKAIQLNPNDEHAYTIRGSAKRDIKDFEGAIVDYNKAIQLNPNLAYIYSNRSILYRKIGEKEKSERDFKKAGELDSSYKKEEWYQQFGLIPLLAVSILCFLLIILEEYVLKTSIWNIVKSKFKNSPSSE